MKSSLAKSKTNRQSSNAIIADTSNLSNQFIKDLV